MIELLIDLLMVVAIILTIAAIQSAEKLDFEFDVGWRSGSPLR